MSTQQEKSSGAAWVILRIWARVVVGCTPEISRRLPAPFCKQFHRLIDALVAAGQYDDRVGLEAPAAASGLSPNRQSAGNRRRR